MASAFKLTVNGKVYQVEADPETPLLYVLRNNLSLNGPKYGCGMERCGSCMVLLNGKAYPSCKIALGVVSKFSIITLEGLGKPDSLHPVQKAFIEQQAAQCGYCINGMIMCAKALLEENHNPIDSEIREALQRVLCRCGTHSRIINAVRKAASLWKR